MTSPLKKLLVVGALMWVAPLGAEPRDTADQTRSAEKSDCPYEHAQPARAEPTAVKADAPLLGRHGPSAALLP